MKQWIQSRLMRLAMTVLVRLNKENLDNEQLLQSRFRLTIGGVPYDGVIVVVNGNLVKIHEAQTVEVNPDGSFKEYQGPTLN